MELWLEITVVVLVVASFSLLIRKKQKFPNSPIFALAIILAVVGITFSGNPLFGYSFLGTSMALSVICAARNSRKK